MVNCKICKDPKRPVINNKMCTKCEGIISSQLKVYEADYTKIRIDNAKFFDVLKRTHEKVTEEELKSYFIDYHLKIFEQELKRYFRKQKRRNRHYGKILV